MPYISSKELKETLWKTHRGKKVLFFFFFAIELPPPTEEYLPFTPLPTSLSRPCPLCERTGRKTQDAQYLLSAGL